MFIFEFFSLDRQLSRQLCASQQHVDTVFATDEKLSSNGQLIWEYNMSEQPAVTQVAHISGSTGLETTRSELYSILGT
jgi:hypothetical protein